MPLNNSLSQLNPNHTLKTPTLILSIHQVCSPSISFNSCEFSDLNSVFDMDMSYARRVRTPSLTSYSVSCKVLHQRTASHS
jgi:hypothetical protein